MNKPIVFEPAKSLNDCHVDKDAKITLSLSLVHLWQNNANSKQLLSGHCDVLIILYNRQRSFFLLTILLTISPRLAKMPYQHKGIVKPLMSLGRYNTITFFLALGK